MFYPPPLSLRPQEPAPSNRTRQEAPLPSNTNTRLCNKTATIGGMFLGGLLFATGVAELAINHGNLNNNDAASIALPAVIAVLGLIILWGSFLLRRYEPLLPSNPTHDIASTRNSPA